MKRIDTCGLSCPQPVLMTRNALNAHPEGIIITTDDITAKKNILRYLSKMGYKAEVTNENSKITIQASKQCNI